MSILQATDPNVMVQRIEETASQEFGKGNTLANSGDPFPAFLRKLSANETIQVGKERSEEVYGIWADSPDIAPEDVVQIGGVKMNVTGVTPLVHPVIYIEAVVYE